MIASRVHPTLFSVRLIALLLGLMTVPAAMAADSAGQVIYEGVHDATSFAWQTAPDGSTYPVLVGSRTLSEPGLPLLPAREMLFLVPLAEAVSRVWVEPLATHRQVLTHDLPLAGDHVTDSGDVLSTRLLSGDGPSFPTSWSREGGTHTWRGYRLLAVTVYPVRQVSDSGTPALEYLDEFAVRVEFTTSAAADQVMQRQRQVPGESRENAKMLSRLVANPEAVGSHLRQNGQAVTESTSAFAPTSAPSLAGSGVRYLIITNEAMRSTFQTLA